MLDSREKDALEKEHRIIRTIWLAMIFTIFVYGMVAFTIVPHAREDAAPNDVTNPLAYAFMFFSVVIVLVLFFIRKSRLSVTKGTPLAATPEDAFAKALPLYRGTQILTFALSEAIAVYGLILVLIGNSPTYIYPFGGCALLLFILLRPKYYELEEFARDHKKIAS